MTDQLSAIRAVPSITLAACVAAVSLIAAPPALAKQACSVAAGSSGYWSWRMIDGRKCWYEGKPMLSKSMLEWSAETPAKADNSAKSAGASPQQHHDPNRTDLMDAEASMPADSTSFDALWRSRIENR